MEKKFGVFGVSYKETPIEIREKLSVDLQSQNLIIPFLKKKCALKELVLLSTCNRVELYYVSSDQHSSQELPKYFLEYLGKGELSPKIFFHYESQEALHHLFSVSASLKSMVIGEPQILGQVKQAYLNAKNNGGVKFYSNKIFQKAFETAKRIRKETSISKFAVSISFAAVELAKRIFDNLNGKRVLIIGAGEMAELAARHLQKAGCSNFMVINRTFTNGVELAKKFSGSAIHFDDLENAISQADIIISSTGSKNYVVRKEHIQNSLKKRKHNSIFLIDIAVPRDIDPEINELSDAYVYDIDDLQNVVSSNLEERKKEAKKAELIIKEELEKFETWFCSLEILPTIKALRAHFHEVASKEVEKLKFQTGEEEDSFQKVDQFSHALIHKLLHQPTVNLKNISSENHKEIANILQQLFPLNISKHLENVEEPFLEKDNILKFKKNHD